MKFVFAVVRGPARKYSLLRIRDLTRSEDARAVLERTPALDGEAEEERVDVGAPVFRRAIFGTTRENGR